MKKFFSIVAVALFALSASAEVLWTENCVKDGQSTYVNKADFNNNWPYANQWFEKGNFENTYTNVASYSCSIRNKKVNASDEQNSIGLYFGANKTADQCYVTFEGTIFTANEGNVLAFNICSPESGSAAESVTPIIKINDEQVTVSAIAVPTQGSGVQAYVALPAVAITKLHISFNSLSTQKFITELRIEDAATGFGHVEAAVKATKMIENGQIVIIRNGVRFNAAGARL